MSLKILLPLIVLCRLATASDYVKDEADRGASDRGTLWFGPRLGKRSYRNPIEDNKDVYEALLEAADALKTYYDQIQEDGVEVRDTKKIFTPMLGRRMAQYEGARARSVDLTPRLGRRLPEELPATPADQEFFQVDPEQIERRTKLFSPRLGRRTVSFSPRLGRELTYDIYPEKIRLARSTNETKST